MKWVGNIILIKSKIIGMWSIINKKGSFNIQHNHPNAYLSAVLLC